MKPEVAESNERDALPRCLGFLAFSGAPVFLVLADVLGLVAIA